MLIYLKSLNNDNVQTQSNSLVPKLMMDHQTDKTPDDCAIHIQVARVQGKPKVNSLKYHI